MSPAPTPSALLAAAVRNDPARPLLTYYDDATGERTELSVVTFDNWVAKTANLLQDGLALDPGARVAIRLPPHWQAAVWLAGCWSVGATAVPASSALQPDVLVTDLAELSELAEQADPPVLWSGGGQANETVALALRPLALPGPGTPPGVVDYDVEVRGYGDRFTPYAPVPPDAAALDVDGAVWSAAELGQAALTTAAEWGLGPGQRLLLAESLTTRRAVLAGLLAPLAAGASVVLCRRLDPAALPQRLARERVTAVLATPSLDAGALTGVRLI